MGNKVGNHYFKGLEYTDVTSYAKNETVAIDGYMFIYKYCAVYRSKIGELFRGKNDMITSHLYGLSSMLAYAKIFFKDVIFVFEGKSPRFKLPQQIDRSAKRQLAKKRYHQAIKQGADSRQIINYKRQIFTVDEKIIRSTVSLLKYMGIDYMFAEEQGEKACEKLVLDGFAQVVWSNDWDILCLNHEKTYRNVYFKNDRIIAQVVNKTQVLKNLQLDSEQLHQMILASGCDYTAGIPKVGPVTAYTLVKKNLLSTIYPMYYEELVDLAKKLTEKSKQIIIVYNTALDILKLRRFLYRVCEFNSLHITKILSLLKNYDNKINKLYLLLPAAPYANGPLHMGRVGGSLLPADIYKRFLKLKKSKTVLIVTVDCHGSPIVQAANLENTEYEFFVNKWCTRIKDTLKKWKIEYDKLHSTLDNAHKTYVKKAIKDLISENYIKYVVCKVLKCEKCNKIVTDRGLIGVCPYCNTNICGLDCENCSQILNYEQVIQPICRICQQTLYLVMQQNYELNLEKHRDEIILHYASKLPSLPVSQFYNRKTNVNKTVLRSLPWGIQIDLLKNKTVYVWIDALYSYLSFTKKYRLKPHIVKHWIGIDNLHFHTIVLGHMLKYENMQLPDDLYVRRWFLFKNNKQSASKCNYLDLYDLDTTDTVFVDFMRAYISYKDTLKHESNLSLDEYNNFVVLFFNTVHNLFYRVQAYYKNSIKLNFVNTKDYLLESAILSSDNKLVWQLIFAKCSMLNTMFQNERTTFSSNKTIKFIRLLYEIKTYLSIFMPEYVENWNNYFLKSEANYTISLAKYLF